MDKLDWFFNDPLIGHRLIHVDADAGKSCEKPNEAQPAFVNIYKPPPKKQIIDALKGIAEKKGAIAKRFSEELPHIWVTPQWIEDMKKHSEHKIEFERKQYLGMAEEKYYVPDLVELHVGFELEFKNVVGVKGKEGSPKTIHDWRREVCDQDLLSIAFDAYEHEDYEGEFADTFRVKYLEPQDIKDLGWQWDEENGVFKISCWFESRCGYFDVHLHYVSKSCHLLLFEGDFDSVPEKQSSTVFYAGKCYNKSELKWITDRVGVKTEKAK